MTGSEPLPEPETASTPPEAAALEAYVSGLFAEEDEHLVRIRQAMADAELPTIQLPAVTGRALQLLLRLEGC